MPLEGNEKLPGWAVLVVALIEAGALVPAVGCASVFLGTGLAETALKTFPGDMMFHPLRYMAVALLFIGIVAITFFVWFRLRENN